MDNDKPLNYRQTLFAEYYAEGETQGNATQSAIKAGYKETTAYSMGQRLLKHVEVKRVIDDRTQEIRAESVATRKIRQEFWTKTMNDSKANMNDRLRASELLGKSEADFTDKHVHETKTTAVEMTEQQREATKKAARAYNEVMSRDYPRLADKGGTQAV